MKPIAKVSLAVAVSLSAANAVSAQQCSDGTPPPCDSRRVVRAKPINPPIDDKTWIVLPFNNVTRAPDAEWLSDASVNLLSMDLSRWQDVHVIDDRRVADFMRAVPTAVGVKLSFNDGVAVARRAGAGRMVLGDVVKVGNLMTVTATVFNVRDGKQIRTTRQETAIADSVIPLFGKLARGILSVPTTDGNVGTVGTARVDAYKEYVAGVQALHKFDAQAARKHFDQALKLDSAFALAHYEWAIASGYDDSAAVARAAKVKMLDIKNIANVMEDSVRIAHAKAAARLSGSLPPRERGLIAGLLALVSHDLPRAVDAYGRLVAADSSDVEALYGYGTSLMSDDLVEPLVPGDTSLMRFRSSWNGALHSFRRAIVIDPTFHLAFDPIVSMLTAPARGGCARTDLTTCADTSNRARYLAPVLRQGDSLVTIPRGGFRSQIELMMEGSKASSPRANIEAARIAAADWAAAGPTEGLAHKHLARLLLSLGRPVEAEQQIAEALLDPTMRMDTDLWFRRLEVAVKTFRSKQVIQLLDSMTRVIPGELGIANYATLAPITGRMSAMDSLYTLALTQVGAPPYVVGLLKQISRITVGVSGDTVAVLERVGLADAEARKPGAKCNAGCLSLLGPGMLFALRTPRTSWPVFGPQADSEPRLAPALALAKNDTTQLRSAARMLDSASKSFARLGKQDDGSSVIAADAYLILNDSAAALATVRRMMDTTLMTTGLDGLLGVGAVPAADLFPRALLLRADLEARAKDGDRALAKDLYAKFLDLWANADPEFAPLLARVRVSLAKLEKK